MEDKSKFQKRKASDSLRLESIKRRKYEKAVQVKQISTALNNLDSTALKNKKIIFDSGSDDDDTEHCTTMKKLEDTNEKLTLFDSSEDENEDYEQRFEIKEQFEGERGYQLFEMSTECPDERFKLDKRFQENEDGSNYFTSDKRKDSSEDANETELEQNKNFEILEKVLGFQVPKFHNKNIAKIKKKKLVRFDPEDEDAENYIRKQDTSLHEELNQKETIIQEKEEINTTKEPVVSKERFFEVATNLKEILSTSDNLGNRFKLFGDTDEHESDLQSLSPENQDAMSSNAAFSYESQNANKIGLPERRDNGKEIPSMASSGHTRSRKMFFMQPNDDRLKEGIAFFQRTESFDTVREQWPVMRNILIEAYKNNRKTVLKSPKPRSKSFPNQKKKYFKN